MEEIHKSATQADIAKFVGLSVSTVCLALQHNPRIPAATQQKVRMAAKKLKYRPDPMLAALVARRGDNKHPQSKANLAALIDARWLGGEEKLPFWILEYLAGIKRVCAQFGYDLSLFKYPNDLGDKAGSADRILHAQGIRGLIFLPFRNDLLEVKISWDQYAMVVIGNPAIGKNLHRVDTDGFDSMNLICTKLKEYGYKSVGLANTLDQVMRNRYEWVGALGKEKILGDGQLKITHPYLPETWTKSGFLQWFQKERPECVVTLWSGVIDWLKEAGYDVPGEVAVALLSRDTINIPDLAGTSSNLQLIGEYAVELLHPQLLRGEYGFQKMPKEVLAYATWVDGASVPRRDSQSKKSHKGK